MGKLSTMLLSLLYFSNRVNKDCYKLVVREKEHGSKADIELIHTSTGDSVIKIKIFNNYVRKTQLYSITSEYVRLIQKEIVNYEKRQ